MYREYCKKLANLETVVELSYKFKDELESGALFPEDCAICYESFKVEDKRHKLHCGHDLFHATCIK